MQLIRSLLNVLHKGSREFIRRNASVVFWTRGFDGTLVGHFCNSQFVSPKKGKNAIKIHLFMTKLISFLKTLHSLSLSLLVFLVNQ